MPSDQIDQVKAGRSGSGSRFAASPNQTFTGTVDRAEPDRRSGHPAGLDLRHAAERRPASSSPASSPKAGSNRADAQGRRRAASARSTRPARCTTVTRIKRRQSRARHGRARPASARDRAGRGHRRASRPATSSSSDRRRRVAPGTLGRQSSSSSITTVLRLRLRHVHLRFRHPPPVITVVSMVALVVFGLVSLVLLQTDEFPDVAVPLVVVSVPYPGASPDNVEREIVEPLEEAIAGISGVQEGPLERARQLRDGCSSSSASRRTCRRRRRRSATRSTRIRNDLPVEMKEPVLTRVNPTDFPILSLALASTDDVGRPADAAGRSRHHPAGCARSPASAKSTSPAPTRAR